MNAAAQAVVATPTSVNRDNYMHMSGEPLRAYAHSLGMAHSEIATMTDEKLKLQCRIAIGRHYEDD